MEIKDTFICRSKRDLQAYHEEQDEQGRDQYFYGFSFPNVHLFIIRSPAAEGHTAPGLFIAFQILFISDSN
jgi:hypothetical protein